MSAPESPRPRGLCSAAVRDFASHLSEESALRLLCTAIEQTDESVVITDVDGTIVYVNPAFESQTGYSREQAIGQNPRILKSGRHQPIFYQRMWQTLTSGRTWRGILVNRRNDRSLFYEEATISPVKNDAGETTHYVAIKRDITASMEMQDRMVQSEKLSAMGQLAAGIAHEICAPLTVILGMAQLLEGMRGMPKQAEEYLGMILKNARRAAGITREMLACSRKREEARAPADLRHVLRETLSLIKHEFIRGKVKVKVSYPAAPPLSLINPEQIKETLINLIINALQAMEQSPRKTLSIRIESGAESNRVRVADTGCGIPNQNFSKIFEPFFTTKPVGKGTGLGLSICYRIAVEHGGVLKAESPAAGGTIFTLELPRHTA